MRESAHPPAESPGTWLPKQKTEFVAVLDTLGIYGNEQGPFSSANKGLVFELTPGGKWNPRPVSEGGNPGNRAISNSTPDKAR